MTCFPAIYFNHACSVFFSNETRRLLRVINDNDVDDEHGECTQAHPILPWSHARSATRCVRVFLRNFADIAVCTQALYPTPSATYNQPSLHIFDSKMLPIVLFLVLVPPSLFLKYIYTGPDTMDLAALSSVVVCATIFISTTYLYCSGERFSKGTLNIVPAGPIAPTCSVYKASLTRRFSPAKPYLLAIIPSCLNPVIYHKFEWAPVSIAASPFAQPTCKATNIPPAVLTSLKSASLVLRRLKGSSNATVWFGVAIVTLISGVCLVGLEAVSWSEEIDEEQFAKSDMIKLPAVIDHQAQAVHVNIRHTIFPERTQRILELDVSTLEAPTLHTLTEDTPTKPKVECSPLQLDSTLEAPVPLTRGDDIPAKPKAEHLHLQLPKCRHVGGRRVPQARLLTSTSTRSPTTRKTARA